jgi:hypothetical protein
MPGAGECQQRRTMGNQRQGCVHGLTEFAENVNGKPKRPTIRFAARPRHVPPGHESLVILHYVAVTWAQSTISVPADWPSRR